MITASTTEALRFPLLSALVFVPLAGAFAVALLSRRRPELPRLVALLFSGAAGAMSVWMLAAFDHSEPGFQFQSVHTWIEEFGIGWHLGVDGISLFLVVLTGLLFPLSIVAVDPHHDAKAYYAWLLVLQAGCTGVFVALDLFQFFIFFEIVLVPMYFLIGGWGYGERIYAALKFFLYTMFGSALMLVGIVSLAFVHRDEVRDAQRPVADDLSAQLEDPALEPSQRAEIQSQLDALEAGQLSFDLVEIAEQRTGALADEQAAIERGDATADPDADSWNPLEWTAAKWIFLAFALAFAVKVPLFPLHTWLPDAHTQAPTAGSVILAGVLLKLGTYGFVRFGLYLFPDATVFFAPVFVTLGVIGVIYGAVVATMQRDLKRLVAYSSVAHLGFIVLGTFSLTTQGVQGGIMQMVNHGISTGALFLLVGMIYERRHTREIAALKGMQKATPILAGVFTVVMLSSIGLPGLNGFVGEFLVLTGSYLTRKWFTVVAAGGVILAALYLLWAYQRVFHGTPEADDEATPEMTWREGAVMAPLIGLIVFMGVYPKPFIDRVEPSVDALVEHIEAATDYEQPGAATSGYDGPLLTPASEDDEHGGEDAGEHDEGHEPADEGEEHDSGGEGG